VGPTWDRVRRAAGGRVPSSQRCDVSRRKPSRSTRAAWRPEAARAEPRERAARPARV
jgi:hypothetical protein